MIEFRFGCFVKRFVEFRDVTGFVQAVLSIESVEGFFAGTIGHDKII